MRNFVPHSLVEVFAQNTVNARLDHEKYGLRPEYGVFSQVCIERRLHVNDRFLYVLIGIKSSPKSHCKLFITGPFNI